MNHAANKRMVELALATATYADGTGDEAFKYALRNEATREVMTYVAECALNPGAGLTYANTLTGENYSFNGMYGLCPRWATGSASQKCQHVVSACVLARINMKGATVALSTRGEDWLYSGTSWYLPKKLQLESSVKVGTQHVYPKGPIASFLSCTDKAASLLGVARNCGWVPGYVGTCIPGASVTVDAGGLPSKAWCTGTPKGSSTGDTMLRVCGGNGGTVKERIHGCDSGAVNMLAQNDDSCGSYPYVSFVCPESGYYNVMWAPKDPALRGVTAYPKAGGFSTAYPAPEAKVFTEQEGAFFGNLWARSSTGTPLINIQNPGYTADSGGTLIAPLSGHVYRSTAMYLNMYACSSGIWNDGKARYHDRLCADTSASADCPHTFVGPCWSSDPLTSVCKYGDGPAVSGDFDFQDCKAGGLTWPEPITTFLNDPCDLVTLDLVQVPACQKIIQ